MTDLELKTTYKGYDITHREGAFKSKFYIISDEDGDEVKSLDSLEACKNWIDRQAKKKFKRVNVIYQQRWLGQAFKRGVATSYIDSGHSLDIWVTGSNKKRCKESSSNVWIDNEANNLKISEYETRKKEIARLEKINKELYNSLETITPEMMDED